MLLPPANGLHQRMRLTSAELADNTALANTCNAYERIELKLNMDMLEQRAGEFVEDFLYYAEGELVGFLGMYGFHSSEVELSGMVHPDHRRRGIFRTLLRAAQAECKARAIPKQIVITPAGSPSGKACMTALQASYSFSEYTMHLQRPPQRLDASAIQLRQATVDDIAHLAQLDALGFHMSWEDAESYTRNTLLQPGKRSYLAVLQQQPDRPIGKITVLLHRGSAFIYGFVVHPDHQKRGYGRQILTETIRLLLDDQCGQISLEVACENAHALGLYHSCGFEEASANDYYVITI